MEIKNSIQQHFENSIQVKKLVAKHCSDSIARAVTTISKALKEGQKILFCGNGGSAADAQHLAAEFVVRLSHDLQRPALPAIALTTDTSILTAGANDLGFDHIFSRQVEALGRAGDVLVGITTSGNSPNVVNAFQIAQKKQMQTIALLGNDGGICKDLSKIPIIVPSNNVQHIQEAHITIGHIIVELVERILFT